jgi:hypothetical protein
MRDHIRVPIDFIDDFRVATTARRLQVHPASLVYLLVALWGFVLRTAPRSGEVPAPDTLAAVTMWPTISPQSPYALRDVLAREGWIEHRVGGRYFVRDWHRAQGLRSPAAVAKQLATRAANRAAPPRRTSARVVSLFPRGGV